MTYTEIKMELKNKELPMNAARMFAKLSENSTQADIDRFVRLNKNLFAGKSEQQLLIEKHIEVTAKIKSLQSLIAEDGEADYNNLTELYLYTMGDMTDAKEYLQNLFVEREQIEKDAEQYSYYDAKGNYHTLFD